jgi:hypothetical protein
MLKRVLGSFSNHDNKAQDRALHQYHISLPSLSCRGRIVGLLRLILVFFLMQAFVLGLAISIAVALSIAFMVTKAQLNASNNNTYADFRVLAWTIFTPWIMMAFSLLMEGALNMTMDAAQNSPRQSMNNHDFLPRYEFIYTVSGGESPCLLHFRANIISILTAAFVPIQPFISPLISNSKAVSSTLINDHETKNDKGDDMEEKVQQKVEQKVKQKVEQKVEPLFPAPDWIIIISEICFWIGFIIFPIIYAGSGAGFRYKFWSFPQAWITIMLINSMIAVVLEVTMNVIVYLWPRASRIRAFITGHSIALYAFHPFIEDVRNRPVIRTLFNGVTCFVPYCPCKRSSGSEKKIKRKSSIVLKENCFNDDEDDTASYYTNQHFNKKKKKTEMKGKERSVAVPITTLNPSRLSAINGTSPFFSVAQIIKVEEQLTGSASCVKSFDREQFQMLNENESFDQFQNIANLHKFMRTSHYNHNHIGPRWWFAVGPPTDVMWDRYCSKCKYCQCI